MNAIRSTTAMLVAAALVTGGCAGRKPNPIDAAQVGDESMTCETIAAESRANAKRIIELKGRRTTRSFRTSPPPPRASSSSCRSS